MKFKMTKAKALKMSQEERREYMRKLHEALKAGEISRDEFEAARAPIREAIISTF